MFETFYDCQRYAPSTYSLHAIDSVNMGVFVNLEGSGIGEGLQRVHSAVLGEGKWDNLQGIGEGSDGVLLDASNLSVSRAIHFVRCRLPS